MLHDFEFNGKKLSDIGAIITEAPSYVLAVREMDFVPIPCKSGDVIVDKNRFKNVSITYTISSIPTFCHYSEQQFAYMLSEWLLTSYDYQILRDTYNVGYFRKAICDRLSAPTVEASGVVSTTITFTCEPFLYSESGTRKVTYKSTNSWIDDTIFNPESWEAEPTIKIIGNGDFACSIGNANFGVDGVTGPVTIDKKTETIYDAEGNPCNEKLTAQALPTLAPGRNWVNVTGTGPEPFIVEIIPNWRRI